MSKKKSSNNKSVNAEKTKKVSTVNNKEVKSKKTKKNKKGKHPKLRLFIKIAIITIIILLIIAAGIIGGVVVGLANEEFDPTNLEIGDRNTTLVDKDGNFIAVLNGDENREIIKLSEMGENIPKAFVAIEDERFYEHNGVDILRTLRATFRYLIGKSSFGGSTITQQLVKNSTKEKEKAWQRKVKEIVRAYQVEKVMSKNQILEAYLNIIPLGGGGKNVHGVQVASKYYFDKNPADLSVAEASFLAGINNAPNTYNPFGENVNLEKINNRTKTVVNKLKELGKITEEEYNQAIEEINNGIAFKQGSISDGASLDWHSESAVNQIVKQMAEEMNLDEKAAKAQLYSGGYTIYTTQDKAIQEIVQTEFNKTTYIKPGTLKNEDGTLKNEHTQAGMVVLDHKTGYVVACAGALGEKTVAFGTNRATGGIVAQPGSSIKPLATIGPGLEEHIITAASVFDDSPKSFGSYTPHNSYSGYRGLMNIRQMITISSNVPEVKLMQKLTPKKSIEYMTRMGLNMENQDEALSLVLGGTSQMQSPLGMAGAYGMIANDGEYIEPTFYTKVVDSDGNTVLEKTQRKERILSVQNAYILKTILKGPVEQSGGTASSCKISGIDVAAKTGSTNKYADRWLCGFTPYYTATTVFGYDGIEEGIHSNLSGNIAMKIWAPIMKSIHKNLESKRFEKPSGLVTATVCKDSGLLANDLCNADQRGSRAYTETFVKGTVPNKTCDVHVKVKVCEETGKLATEHCPNAVEKVFITRPNSEEDTSWKSAGDAQYMAPTETCDVHTEAQDKEKPVITLKGNAKVTVKLNEKYTDAGATAKDNVDGDLTEKILTEIKKDEKVVEKIDTSKEGTYTITYTVTDKAGNIATATRTVKVQKEDNTTDNKDKDKDKDKNNTNTNSTGGNSSEGNTVTNSVGNTVTDTTNS